MQRLFCLCFVLCGCLSFGQIIEIPDPNFKDLLVNGQGYPNNPGYLPGFDINGDLEIDMAEAEAITSLQLHSPGYTDLTGIRSFVNLEVLDATYCNIQSFDLSGLENLQAFYCHYNFNQTTSVNLEGCTSLKIVSCGSNPIQNLNVSGCVSLESIYSRYHQLTALDLSNLPNLKIVEISDGPLTSVDLSETNALEQFHAFNTELQTLDLSERHALTIVNVGYSKLTHLDLSNSEALSLVYCGNGLLQEIVLSGCTGLLELDCSLNRLPAIDLTDTKNLRRLYCSYNLLTAFEAKDYNDNFPRYFDCSNNQISTVDVSGNNIQILDCHNNQIKQLDLSDRESLIELIASNNQLEYLNITNSRNSPLLSQDNYYGDPYGDIDLSGNPNLQFVCADAHIVGKFRHYLDYIGSGAKVSDKCSFPPTLAQNPVTDYVLLQSIENPTTVRLFDISGKMLSEIHHPPTMLYIDMRPYASGIYLLQAEMPSLKTPTVKKIVKL